MKTCSQCQVKYPDVLEFCPRDGSPLPPAPSGSVLNYDPLIGTTIDGRYAIEAALGEGGMGVVYKARHVLIDKTVAIKILRKEAAQDAASVQRFIQEAKSASKINHSNIVDITDFGVLADGHAYFVMEFLQGQTLAQAIHESPLDAARVCVIGAQMARGLHAAHQKGIVHRDLKPENIFLLEREGNNDFVKIVDFGIAKVGGGQRLTQVGMVLGTPEYMSPEQATGQETDHRVDQYALGCIMYEMLTGVVPFLGERPAQTLTKHVFEAVVPPQKRKPELNIPAAIEAVVLRTLAKKPADRFPSMRDLELALAQVESELRASKMAVDEPRTYRASQPGQPAQPFGQDASGPAYGQSSGAATQSFPAYGGGNSAPFGPGPTQSAHSAQAIQGVQTVVAPAPQPPQPVSAMPGYPQGGNPSAAPMQQAPQVSPGPQVPQVPQVSGPVIMGYAQPAQMNGPVAYLPASQQGYGAASYYSPGPAAGNVMAYPAPGVVGAVSRPTRESLPAQRSRRMRSILAMAFGGALFLGCVLLAYSFLNRPAAAPGPPGLPPRIDKPLLNPPEQQPERHPDPQVELPPVQPKLNPPPPPVTPPPTGDVSIVLTYTPDSAVVLVDRKRCRDNPCRLTRPRGATFRVEAHRPGYSPYDKEMRAEDNEEVPVVLSRLDHEPVRDHDRSHPPGTKKPKQEPERDKDPPKVPHLPSKQELRNPFDKRGDN